MNPAPCSFNISDAHVLALIAMADTENTFRGLDFADDEYLVKPIVKREFVARVHSMVRRVKPTGEVPVEYRNSVISLDLLTHDTSFRGKAVHMRPTLLLRINPAQGVKV